MLLPGRKVKTTCAVARNAGKESTQGQNLLLDTLAHTMVHEACEHCLVLVINETHAM
jgi:hypothetical protein